jgi:hypothetical protein
MTCKWSALKRQAFAVTASSSMWLLVAMVQSQGQAHESNAEALKMCYLTSPADVNLIPTRLRIVSTSVTTPMMS